MSFQNFIVKQLAHAGVSKEHRIPIYEGHEELFRQAVTHKSFEPSQFNDIKEVNKMLKPHKIKVKTVEEIERFDDNEKLEFRGDRYLKGVHGRVLSDKYPELSEGGLTFAFQKLIGEKVYGKEGERLGFFNFLLTSPAVMEQAIHWKNGDIDKVNMAIVKKYWRKGERENVYLKLLEDALEAFGCALVEAVDLYTKSLFGPGMGMLFRWARPIMDNLPFDPTNIKVTKAPGMQLKELWEDIYADKYMEGYKFTNEAYNLNQKKVAMFKIDQKNRSLGYIPIMAIDPFLPWGHKEKIIAKTHGESEKDARRKASEIALKYLYKWRKKEIEAGREKKGKK